MAREKTFATWRENINCGNIWREESAFCLACDPDSILRIKQSNISAEKIPENAVRMDAEYSNPDAEYKIYAWLTDDGTMHYWTNADTTRLPDESRFLFSELSNVIEIDLSGIDTSDMKDMGFMFSCCPRLKSLDLSSFDTSKVTDMSHMFSNCYNLTSLDLSRFDTSNVTNMEYMFWNCQELKVLDLSSFDTAKVQSMASMFDGCSRLRDLDLSSFDMPNVVNTSKMFDCCSSLKSLSVSETAETRRMIKGSGIKRKSNATQRKSKHQHER